MGSYRCTQISNQERIVQALLFNSCQASRNSKDKHANVTVHLKTV